jgi:hypothetical protein
VPKKRPLDSTDLLAAILIMASMVSVLWHLQDSSVQNANTGSRYATVEALVDYGTWIIDDTIFHKTIDRVVMDGHSYSSKPPLLPTYAAGVYWLYQAVTGKKIAEYEGDVVWFGSLTSGWLFHLIFLVYFYRLMRLLLRNEWAALGGLACAGFAYLGVGYAATLNNHSIGACLALVGFYYAVRAQRAPEDVRPWIFSGLWLGFLPGLDLPALAISGVIGVYLFATDRNKALFAFAPALLPGLALHLILTYVSSGSLIPIYMRRDLYDYAGSYWNNEAGIDALREHKLLYTFNSLLGHHGLFSMTPIFAFSAWELFRTIQKKLPLYREALVVLAISVVLGIFYTGYSHNYGGWCVGMRWFIPFMPFLLVFVGVWLDRLVIGVTFARVAPGVLFLAAFGVSQFHVQDALTSPFQFSVWHNWLENRPNRNRIGVKMNLGKAGENARKTRKKEQNKAESDDE